VRQQKLIVVDDDRFELNPGETTEMREVRFRTLGCYPLTAGEESKAYSLDDIIHDLETTRLSERAGRLIDGEGMSSMEAKKVEGYF
jgi:sulfate adenylyltransferase subunit 2